MSLGYMNTFAGPRVARHLFDGPCMDPPTTWDSTRLRWLSGKLCRWLLYVYYVNT